MEPIKVMIVEDSPLMRNFLADRIGSAPGFDVIATAHNGADAREKIMSEGPDVITLDVELPDSNGIEILEQIMKIRPTSVVMVSALTQSGAQTTLRALQLGAVDFVGKPTGAVSGETDEWMSELLLKLRRAATIRPARRAPNFEFNLSASAIDEKPEIRSVRRCPEKVILVGGGSAATEAARRFVLNLPRECPAVLIALQCSPVVTKALLLRISRETSLQVKLAFDNELMIRGHIYFGPGDVQLGVVRSGAQWHVKFSSGENVRGARPNLDAVFESGSRFLGQEIAGVLLDAAGEDGTMGLWSMTANHSRAFRQAREDNGGITVRSDRVPTGTRACAGEPAILPLDKIVAALFGS
jgi:two-component system chemotaxis response regulator CheB